MLAGVLIVALGVVLAVVVTGNATGHHAHGGDDGAVGGMPGLRVDGTSPFRAADADTVVLDGVSGRIQVTADPHAHTVTGSFHRSDGHSAVLHGTTGDDPASGDGHTLTVRCEDDDGHQEACAGDLVLTVPGHTGLRMRQTSGETVLDGLGGDLSLDASSLQLTTRDLRSPHAEVRVVSGSADLGFGAAPADLDLHASSASVAVRLPQIDGGYAVTTAAASASVQVQVPRDPTAGHRVALTVTSGSLSVQNA
ncbi:hypothetical protein [Actinacidiphila acidipaludis]|uniref:Adhesin domain-containing protein n=1 Tax=Actinacidiphila acidipaludis TaxID=2873382 RepID=A0ABS7QG93_9ACTN|nr:hypothetical protein [Streptomyces acidipaludis]MBY8882189.1 hypothetical protein [Streptomyces acidipaludis]